MPPDRTENGVDRNIGENRSADILGAFSGQQRTLLQALEQKNPSLATMYLGGFFVLSDVDNPDRFALCAHSIRELMEKIPTYLNVSTKAQQESLKSKARELEDSYSSMCQRTSCLDESSRWDGPIDNPLRKFLRRLGQCLDWFDTHHPRRRKEIGGMLERLEGTEGVLPPQLASLNVDAWTKIRDFFVGVSHHRIACNETDIRQWLDALERFLLDRLVPRTFDDFNDSDSLFDEESGNA